LPPALRRRLFSCRALNPRRQLIHPVFHDSSKVLKFHPELETRTDDDQGWLYAFPLLQDGPLKNLFETAFSARNGQ
jgi:hypothetical protein